MTEKLFRDVMSYLGPNADPNEVAWSLGMAKEKIGQEDLELLRRIEVSRDFEECLKIFMENGNKVVAHRALTRALGLAKTQRELKEIWLNAESFSHRSMAIHQLARMFKAQRTKAPAPH